MKWLLAAILAAFLVYLIYDTVRGSQPILARRGRLCDYTAAGSVYEDIPSALARGIRLLEVHVYSDEQDQPVVAMRPQQSGRDFSEDNVSFEQVCIDLVNDAFPSKDPMILSIVLRTDKSVTINKVAEHLTTITRKHLIPDRDVHDALIDDLANKLIVVSGGNVLGSALEPLLNLSWSDTSLRRLSYQQALHPRDPNELEQYNKFNITLVGPEVGLKTITENPGKPRRLGCQWNVVDREGSGFSLVR